MYKISFPRIIFPLVSSLLAACTAGPDFVRPAPPTVPSYNSGGDDLTGPQRLTVQSKLPSEWWRLFGDSALDQTMVQALVDNKDLAATRATLAQAQEEVKAKSGGLWPQISLDGAVGRQKYGVALFGPSNFAIPPFTYYTAGPQVSYLLDFAGGEHRVIEQQKALAEYQGYQSDAARLSLTGNVMAQTLGIMSAKAQIAVINDILEDDRKNVDLVQKSREAGAGTITDVLSVQSQLAEDQALLPALRQQLDTAQHALSILVGKAPSEWVPPDFELNDFKLPGDLPMVLPSALVRARPDILASESELHATSAAIGVAAADLYPSVKLTANMFQEALTPANLFDAGANAWAAAANLTAPIFDGGTLHAKKRAAEDAYQAALARYQQVVLQSFGQVADVLKALEHDNEQIEAQKHALDTAQSSVRLTRLSYNAGNIGVLQILDAERLSNQARLAMVRARAQQFQDTALLFLALGGGTPT